MKADSFFSRIFAPDIVIPEKVVIVINMRNNSILVLIVMLVLTGTVFGDAQVADFSSTMSDTVEITVENKGLTFAIDTIKVKRGTTVILTFVNTGGTHDWRLDEFGAATSQIRTGQSETIEFAADQSGEFEYYCSVGNHRRAGMWGTFIVVE